jgi:hypothetical protein
LWGRFCRRLWRQALRARKSGEPELGLVSRRPNTLVEAEEQHSRGTIAAIAAFFASARYTGVFLLRVLSRKWYRKTAKKPAIMRSTSHAARTNRSNLRGDKKDTDGGCQSMFAAFSIASLMRHQ